ncbi:hypothetical protein M5689_004865 [Euphorbia peplus]|nr:hypothetical protein M5689_004865 [Euphorbia peplus]
MESQHLKSRFFFFFFLAIKLNMLGCLTFRATCQSSVAFQSLNACTVSGVFVGSGRNSFTLQAMKVRTGA